MYIITHISCKYITLYIILKCDVGRNAYDLDNSKRILDEKI